MRVHNVIHLMNLGTNTGESRQDFMGLCNGCEYVEGNELLPMRMVKRFGKEMKIY